MEWEDPAAPKPSPAPVAAYVNYPKGPLQDEVPFGYGSPPSNRRGLSGAGEQSLGALRSRACSAAPWPNALIARAGRPLVQPHIRAGPGLRCELAGAGGGGDARMQKLVFT